MQNRFCFALFIPDQVYHMVIKSGASSHSRRRSETPHHRRRQPERHRQKFTHISATGRRALKHSRLDGSFLHDSSPGAKRTRLRRQRSLHDIVDSLRRPECDAQPLNSPFPLSLSSHTSRSHITHHPHDTLPMQTAHRSYHVSARQPSSKYKTLDTRRSAQHATCERAAILVVLGRTYVVWCKLMVSLRSTGSHTRSSRLGVRRSERSLRHQTTSRCRPKGSCFRRLAQSASRRVQSFQRTRPRCSRR